MNSIDHQHANLSIYMKHMCGILNDFYFPLALDRGVLLLIHICIKQEDQSSLCVLWQFPIIPYLFLAETGKGSFH